MSILIVGLGNPDPEYTGTRHNIGRDVLDVFAHRYGIEMSERNGYLEGFVGEGTCGDTSVIMLKPDQYMNNSGVSVKKALKHYELTPDDVVIVHDELDVPLGMVKISHARSAGGHNGVQSVIDQVQSKKCIRIRVGIATELATGEMVKPKGQSGVQKFVLNTFATSEREALPVITKAASDALVSIITNGVTRTMNQYNGVKLLENKDA